MGTGRAEHGKPQAERCPYASNDLTLFLPCTLQRASQSEKNSSFTFPHGLQEFKGKCCIKETLSHLLGSIGNHLSHLQKDQMLSFLMSLWIRAFCPLCPGLLTEHFLPQRRADNQDGVAF